MVGVWVYPAVGVLKCLWLLQSVCPGSVELSTETHRQFPVSDLMSGPGELTQWHLLIPIFFLFVATGK